MSRVLPILFNTNMVRANLDGRKTATRRVVKLSNNIKQQDDGRYTLYADGTCYEDQRFDQIIGYIKKPCQPGDILYVRETWCNANIDGVEPDYYYYADVHICEDYDRTEWKWRPSIHMPKDAARIWLKVTSVRVERLRDITEKSAKMEGFSCKDEFIQTFLKMYPECTEESWLWVIEFERCEKPASCILKGVVSEINAEACEMCAVSMCKQRIGND